MPDIVLDYHRLKTPIDHPDQSITRTKLEYPTIDVNFAYLASIGKTKGAPHVFGNRYGVITITSDNFTDKAVDAWVWDKWGGIKGRYIDYKNFYCIEFDSGQSTKDLYLTKCVNGTCSTLGYEAVDIPSQYAYLLRLSISGSTLKAYRAEPTGLADSADATATPKITATDTSIASGYWGPQSHLYGGGHSEAAIAWLRAPSSPSLPAQVILEVSTEGSGKPEYPLSSSMRKNLVEVASLTGLPDFLHQEARKYYVLKAKGFMDEEIKLLFGYVPQHQVDLDAVPWGAFEFSEKSPTNIIMVNGDNPYKSGAVQRQIEYAKSRGLRVFTPPKDYNDAISLYNQLKKDYSHWLAGVHNWCYQVFGLEEFDWFQNVDFYYGEFIDHKTHYNQLKQVPDWEIRNRLNELIDKLSRVKILTEERDKHISKAKEILKKGW